MPRRIDTAALFEVVVQLYAERGYVGTTTADIAAAAGVSEVTLYRRWTSKAGLIAAALADRLAATPFAHLAATGDVRADLRAIVDAFGATRRAYGGVVTTLLAEAPRHAELAPALGALVPNLENVGRILASHQAEGRLVAEDPRQQLALLLAPLIASGLWERAGGPLEVGIDPEGLVTGFLDGHAGPG